MHDESAYQDLFATEFPANEQTGEFRLEQRHVKEINDGLFPIVYYAEQIPIHSASPEEHYKLIFELLEILSETEMKDYFLTGFIQRLIDFMWDS
jgi:hypothetical protein